METGAVITQTNSIGHGTLTDCPTHGGSECDRWEMEFDHSILARRRHEEVQSAAQTDAGNLRQGAPRDVNQNRLEASAIEINLARQRTSLRPGPF